MYNEKVMNIFKNPTNVGIVQSASAVGQYIDELTADNFKLYIKLEEGKIVESSFKAFCGIVGVAMMSTLTEMIKGLSIDELSKFDVKRVEEVLGKFESKDKYLLEDCYQTILATCEDYQKRLEKEEKKSKK